MMFFIFPFSTNSCTVGTEDSANVVLQAPRCIKTDPKGTTNLDPKECNMKA
jgi:hypothetical protein